MTALNPELVHLRPAEAQDRDFLWWLHCETMRDYVDKTWGWDENFQRERFQGDFDPELLQVIEYERCSIGYISVQRPGDEIFLLAIEIAPEFQNHRIGTHLVQTLLDESDEKNLPVKLFVLKVNPARGLYERLGFRCASETPTHYIMKRIPGTARNI